MYGRPTVPVAYAASVGILPISRTICVCRLVDQRRSATPVNVKEPHSANQNAHRMCVIGNPTMNLSRSRASWCAHDDLVPVFSSSAVGGPARAGTPPQKVQCRQAARWDSPDMEDASSPSIRDAALAAGCSCRRDRTSSGRNQRPGLDLRRSIPGCATVNRNPIGRLSDCQ